MIDRRRGLLFRGALPWLLRRELVRICAKTVFPANIRYLKGNLEVW